MADVGWYSSSFFLAQVAFQNPLGKAYYVFGFKQVFVGAILFFQIGCIGAAIYLFCKHLALSGPMSLLEDKLSVCQFQIARCTPVHLHICSLARSIHYNPSRSSFGISRARPALPCPAHLRQDPLSLTPTPTFAPAAPIPYHLHRSRQDDCLEARRCRRSNRFPERFQIRCLPLPLLSFGTFEEY